MLVNLLRTLFKTGLPAPHSPLDESVHIFNDRVNFFYTIDKNAKIQSWVINKNN